MLKSFMAINIEILNMRNDYLKRMATEYNARVNVSTIWEIESEEDFVSSM